VSSEKTVEFFFDFSSPWTYMAFTQVETLCTETGAALQWKPFYVAAVFRDANHSVQDMRERPIPSKLAYYKADMQRWAERLGIRIGRPPVYGGGSQPLNSAAALRGALVAIDGGRISEYAGAVFRAYWDRLEDVSDRGVLAKLADEAGLDARAFAERIDAKDIRNRLRDNTDEFVSRGGFGTPTFFVDRTDMYFGNDRLDFVREALT
jgi:2-hydroxychromene-2-carboxylate isomerase